MKNERTIKYQHATGENNELISIHDVTRENKVIFRCISCEKTMIAKIRNQGRRPHFAHKMEESANNCSTETYLHYLGKKIFYREYQKCLDKQEPFHIDYKYKVKRNHILENIHSINKEEIEKLSHNFQIHEKLFGNKIAKIIIKELNSPCKYYISNKEQYSYAKYNLTEKYKHIKLEKKHDEFIPDLTLQKEKEDKKDIIYIEIFVTHKIDSKKEISGNKIIEIEAKSEDDFRQISDHYISIQKKSVTAYNFSIKSKENSNEISAINGYHFIIFNSGKTTLKECTFKEYANYKKNNEEILFNKFIFGEDESYYRKAKYIEKILTSYNKGFIIRDCNFCIHSGLINYGSKEVFCRKDKDYCETNEAENCGLFSTEGGMKPANNWGFV